MTAGDPVAQQGDGRDRRAAWRDWRKTRPFWGGLLIVIAGLEIISTTVLSLGPTFRVGLGGVNAFFGTVVAIVLAICGLLLLFSPAQRLFYSIVAVILSLASFNTINYGGFFIGMLLGLIGGGLAFAWSPATPPALADPPGDPAQTQPAGDPQPPGRGRMLSVAAPLAAGLLAAPALPAHPAAAPQAAPRAGAAPQAAVSQAAVSQAASTPRASSGCILFILCPPSSTGPQPGPSGHPRPGSTPSPGSTSGGGPGTGQQTGGKPGPIKRTPFSGDLVASDVPAVLNAGSAQLVGLAYDGVAQVPVASGGTQPMMKFSLRSVTLTGHPTLTIHQNGSVATTSTSLLSFTGNVVLYATKLSGDLLGIPITLTTGSPLSLVLQLLRPLTQGLTVTMTNVVTSQPTTTAAASTWSDFLISVKPA